VQLNSLPSEPYDPNTDPDLKGTFDEFKIVNAAIDEVVDKLLIKAAERVLKEDDQSACKNIVKFVSCLYARNNCKLCDSSCNIFLCVA
jgi:hypothetical protein